MSIQKQFFNSIIACSLFLSLVILINSKFPFLEVETRIENKRTISLMEDRSPKLVCYSGEDHEFLFVRCQSNTYGRMRFLWTDTYGKQHILDDALYTKDYGVLLLNGTREIVVTFTDMNLGTDLKVVKVVSTWRRDCIPENSCFRV